MGVFNSELSLTISSLALLVLCVLLGLAVWKALEELGFLKQPDIQPNNNTDDGSNDVTHVARQEQSPSHQNESTTERFHGNAQFAFKAVLIAFCYAFALFAVVLAKFYGILSCSLAYKLSASSFQLGKGVMYAVFVDRLDSVFGGSTFAYSKKTISVLYSSIISVTLAFCVIWIVTLEGMVKHKVVGIRRCVQSPRPKAWFSFSVLLFDVVISLITLRMFTVPLRGVLGMLEMDDELRKLGLLAKKITLLTWVSVLSTAVMVLYHVIAADTHISGFCMAIQVSCILMFPSWFDEYYPRLCAIPIWLSDNCCKVPSLAQMELRRVHSLQESGHSV